MRYHETGPDGDNDVLLYSMTNKHPLVCSPWTNHTQLHTVWHVQCLPWNQHAVILSYL